MNATSADLSAHRGTIPDAATCYKAVSSRDRRFDGVFYTAVATTGIYCRPSCPARTPARPNVTFYPTAAAAQAAGYRACKRCIPDATPGSPQWDVHASTAGRAMRLIADGVVDREGVGGLASRLGYTPRHLNRVLTTELGAGPLALARARRAQTARSLIDATSLSFTEIAFAAGFDSVRQFNDTVRAVYGTTPTQLRGRRGRPTTAPGTIRLRVAVRTPFHGSGLLRFLRLRAVAGVETAGDGWYARSLRLPHAPGTIRVELPDLPEPGTATIGVELALGDLRDIAAVVERVGRLLDADCDPVAVAAALCPDPLLGPLLRRWPGLRLPGHVDGAEVAVRAIVGQQISVAGARTILGRLVKEYGEPLPAAGDLSSAGLTHLFPTPEALAGLEPDLLPMPRARGRALVGLCRALIDGELALDRGSDRHLTRTRLLALPGIGGWTAGYVALRALGDPDAFLATDLGTRQALAQLGADPARAGDLAESWRPWRSYAQSLLWQTTTPGTAGVVPAEESRRGPRQRASDHLLLDPEGLPDVARD